MPIPTADRAAVVIPGRMFGPHVPLLRYAGDAAKARGARLRRVSWRPPDRFSATDGAPAIDPVEWVRGQIGPVVDEVAENGSAPLLIGKSLGSYAASLAADRSLPAVWLTPLLFDDQVVDALRRTAAPFLLVGGTADPHAWDGDRARSLTPHVLEVADADHGMYVPGPLAGSATVLGLVATAVEEFLDNVVWPSGLAAGLDA